MEKSGKLGFVSIYWIREPGYKLFSKHRIFSVFVACYIVQCVGEYKFTIMPGGMKRSELEDQMRKFLKFVHDDNVYYKYYEVVYILFHTGMRISDAYGKIRLKLDKPSKYKGLGWFSPFSKLQRSKVLMEAAE